MGSASISRIVAQVRRLRSSLLQLDADHAPTASGARVARTVSLPAPVAASTTSSSVCRSAASSLDPDPGRDQLGVEPGGVGGADQQPASPSTLLDPVAEHGAGAAPGSGAHHDPPGGAAQVVELLLQHHPAAVEHPDPGAHLLDLGEQVAGDEDGGAVGVQREQQRADLADALRVEPVGRLVEHQQPRAAQQGVGQPEALAHAEGVGPDRPVVHAAEPDPVEGVLDPAGARRRRLPAPMASKSARLARPDRWA